MDNLQDIVLWNRQADLERKMQGLGAERFRAALAKAKENGRESEVGAGMGLLKQVVAPLSKAIADFVAAANSGKAGRRHLAYKYIANMDPTMVAYLTAKSVIDSLSKMQTLRSAAMHVSRTIEYEARFEKFEAEKGALFAKIKADLDKRGQSRDHQHTVLVHAMNKAEVEWKTWPETDRLHLGIKLIELLMESTGIVRVYYKTLGKNNTQPFVTATDEAINLLSERNARSELMMPVYLPCVMRPKPWTGPFGGGYWTNSVPPLTLVKTRSRGYLEELKHIDMPEVYGAVNALQDTAWRINTRVLDVARALWDRGATVAGLPARDVQDIPAKPADIETNEEARKEWRRAAAKVYQVNAKQFSQRIQTNKIISIAEEFEKEEALYFPYQLDFRGRIYAVPLLLNPQGNDLAKGLLTFAHGAPIEDGVAAGWLAIHCANTYGYDKAALADRIAWVEEHEDLILSCAADPLANLWWTEADKPFQFLAACFEWAGFQEQGFGYVSSLPIAMDGSCNGLQHFSAMLRDPVGGAAVNLLPSDRPEDIYQRVADKVMDKLRRDLSSNGKETELAKLWLDFGVDRKITKRPVMVLPYGGTYMACLKYVAAAVDEKTNGNPERIFGERVREATVYLSKLIWQSIGEVVIAAREAMSWLQKAARLAAKEGLPITWRVPSGFPVQQAYWDVTERRVKTRLNGSLVYLRLHEQVDKISEADQASGIAPNFVHSLDAAALVGCVTKAREQGITSFAMVHDSYGTLAAHTDLLGQCLRAAFVELYENHDVLEDFRQNILDMLSDERREKLPPIPDKGELDIRQVLESDFFFA
ncbi:MAG: DNA-directed RNA polymerase [Ferrovibrio sp.]|uniref:DNA-directed RNA polymerase n=1 Tax=Ferrovibrio sp. TaxID=1917215 RepID=UPI00391B02B1